MASIVEAGSVNIIRNKGDTTKRRRTTKREITIQK